jgi:hypothetical protein
VKSLLPLWHTWLRFYYRWALSEIDPMHPDVPAIVHRLAELEPA